MSLSTRIFWLIVAVLLVAAGFFALGAERQRAEHRTGVDGGAVTPR